jgi:hypothetical protein
LLLSAPIMSKRIAILFVGLAACAGLPLPSYLGGGTSQHNTTTTTTTTTSEETHASVNGEPVATMPAPQQEHRARSRKMAYGSTCHTNDQCVGDNGGCYKGYGGQVGYCTSSCNDDFSCPDFWECKRPAGLNTPSKICLQPKE